MQIRSITQRSLFIIVLCVFESVAYANGAPACAQASLPADTTFGTLDVQLNEVRVLGNDPSAASQYLFGLPQFVATDEHGRIYVADAIPMNVKVYSKEGKYLRTIGTRGKGRGELQSIKGMAVEKGEVLVFDRTNARVTRFAQDGRVLDTYSVSIPSSTRLRAFADKRKYAVLYSASNAGIEPSGNQLFHIYGSNFKQARVEFGFLSEVADAEEAVVQVHYSHFPGRFTFTDEGHVVYAPALYDGKLYQYQQKNGSWTLGRVLKGYTENPPYTEVTSASRDTDRADMVTSIVGRATPLAARLHNRTRGLFQREDGRFVHFTFSEFGNRRVFGVEVFGQDGSLVGYGPIRSVELNENGIASLWWEVACKDDQDRFYIIDREGEVPVVRIVELSVRERN